MRRMSLVLVLVALVAVPVVTSADDEHAAPVLVNESYEKADARKVVLDIARLANANIVVSQDFGGTISVTFTDVPWRDALEQVVRARGFALVGDQHGTLRVVKEVQPELKTAFFRFRHRQLGDGSAHGASASGEPPLVAALNLILRRDHGEMKYIREQNTVIYTGIPSVLEGVEALLKVFDQPRARTARETPGTAAGADLPQVFVDTKVVRVRPSDVEHFCLGAEPGVVSLRQASALLKRWKDEKVVDDSFGPLLALDGQQATMFVGEVMEVDGKKTELGKHLAVTPVIDQESNRIALGFSATWRRLTNEPKGERPAGWQPQVEVRHAQTDVVVSNGAWLFLRLELQDVAQDVLLLLVNCRLVGQ